MNSRPACRLTGMEPERVTASTTIEAAPKAVFAVLADPSTTTVTLTYDWSAVPPPVRENFPFPPFGPDHLDNSLRHLSDLVA